MTLPYDFMPKIDARLDLRVAHCRIPYSPFCVNWPQLRCRKRGRKKIDEMDRPIPFLQKVWDFSMKISKI